MTHQSMSNEQKARELCECAHCEGYESNCICSRFAVIMQMAQWKDEKHEQEKQQWIVKACEWIKKLMVASGNYDTYDMQENLKDFKKAMKGE